MEDNKEVVSTNDTGVTGDNYASMLSEAINSKDAEIRAIKEAQARQIKDLTTLIVNQRSVDSSDEDKQEVIPSSEEIQKLRVELFADDKEHSNLEYVTKALELREAILKKEGRDIFVGRGSNFEPTQEDYYRAENTAEIFKECVEYAQGDSEAFTTELMRRTKR